MLLDTRKGISEVGRYYQVTGRRGHAKRYLGATGLCTDAYTDEGRGNLSTRYWSTRITLSTASGSIVAGLPLSQLTEISKEVFEAAVVWYVNHRGGTAR